MTVEEIEAELAKPKRIRTTTAEVERHSAEELIMLDKYLAEKSSRANSSSALGGLRITRANPPGAV